MPTPSAHARINPKHPAVGRRVSASRANHRFDVVQQRDDPTRFVLVEAYRTAEDVARHKQTAHYLTWRDAVASLMAQERRGVQYTNIFPEDTGWDSLQSS